MDYQQAQKLNYSTRQEKETPLTEQPHLVKPNPNTIMLVSRENVETLRRPGVEKQGSTKINKAEAAQFMISKNECLCRIKFGSETRKQRTPNGTQTEEMIEGAKRQEL